MHTGHSMSSTAGKRSHTDSDIARVTVPAAYSSTASSTSIIGASDGMSNTASGYASAMRSSNDSMERRTAAGTGIVSSYGDGNSSIDMRKRVGYAVLLS